MEENFNVIAQSRANYYTPGSPIQFVRIEVLKGDQSGEHAICLTFKNIAVATITRLSISFKCKGTDGSVLCEQVFHYDDIEVKSGELFGMDDAVFVSQVAIGSADVVLEKVYSGKKVMTLNQIKRVRLPALQKLDAPVAQELARRIGRDDLHFMPQLLESGWYCACGAFHPKEENTVYCSECGSDRILLQNTIQAILQPVVTHQHATSETPTVVVGSAMAGTHAAQQDAEHTKMFQATPEEQATVAIHTPKQTVQPKPVPTVPVEEATVAIPAAKPVADEAIQQFAKNYQEDQARATPRYDDDSYNDYDDDDEEDYEDPRDVVAENIIRWVPALTAMLCAGIAIAGFCYCNFVL